MNALRIGAQVGAAKTTARLFSVLGDLFAQLERPRWREDPYPLYERIRAKGPVYRAPSGIRAVSSFVLCNQVLRDRRFGMKAADGVTVPMSGLGVVQEHFPESFLDMDPPDHTRLRRLSASAFNPKRVESYRPRIQRTVDALLSRVPERFDLVADVAAPLPIIVISDLAVALGEEKLTTQELFGMATLLLIAGFETTVNLIGNGVNTLLGNPSQRSLLRADDSLAASAAEETLRYEPPVQGTTRIAHTDVELAGHRIKAGRMVGVLIAAGNRDASVFPDSHRFDITLTEAPPPPRHPALTRMR